VKDPATGSIARALAVQMEQITADGANKVSIKLSSPNADLPAILATMHFAIVKDGTTDFSKGNGTGPFLCKEFQPGVHSLAVRNPNYWKPGKPYLDEIEIFSIQDETARLNALMAGDIHIAAKLSMRFAQRAKTAANVAVLETPSGGYNDFILRQDSELTRNPDLVLALKYLQDRKQLQSPGRRRHRQRSADRSFEPLFRSDASSASVRSGQGQIPFEESRHRLRVASALCHGRKHHGGPGLAAAAKRSAGRFEDRFAEDAEGWLLVERVVQTPVHGRQHQSPAERGCAADLDVQVRLGMERERMEIGKIR
jgi:hypothetical protein